MINSEYSPYKVIHHIDKIMRKQPVSVSWNITNKCNHNCHRCLPPTKPHFSYSDQWEVEDIRRVALELKESGIKSIIITGGEPLYHVSFDEILELLLQYFEVALMTNGSLLLNCNINLLRRLTWIRISIDATSLETYILLRGMDMPDFGYIVSLLKHNDNVIGCSFLIQPENINEISIFAYQSRQWGFDNCKFNFLWPPQFGQDNSRFELLLKQALSYSRNNFKVFLPIIINNKKEGFSHCYYSDLVLVISANQNLYTCCALKDTDIGLVGSLKQYSVSTLLKNRKSDLDINKCSQCLKIGINQFIEYLLCRNPKHVNFP